MVSTYVTTYWFSRNTRKWTRPSSGPSSGLRDRSMLRSTGANLTEFHAREYWYQIGTSIMIWYQEPVSEVGTVVSGTSTGIRSVSDQYPISIGWNTDQIYDDQYICWYQNHPVLGTGLNDTAQYILIDTGFNYMFRFGLPEHVLRQIRNMYLSAVLAPGPPARNCVFWELK